LDDRYHLYSQCLFTEHELGKEDEKLGEAAQHKLNHMERHLRLKRTGGRVLDIGGGWGGGISYYGRSPRVNVTSLTIADDSTKYRDGIKKKKDEVLLEDLLEHRRREYYDAVVILGVIEHIPNYGRFCERVWDALKPGGMLYLDASATKQKYAASAFTRRYT